MRERHSPAFKAQVVQELLKEQKTVCLWVGRPLASTGVHNAPNFEDISGSGVRWCPPSSTVLAVTLAVNEPEWFDQRRDLTLFAKRFR